MPPRRPFEFRRLRALVSLLGLSMLSGCANGIFYQPSRRMDPSPAVRGLQVEPLRFAASDGTPLTGWWLPAQGESRGVVLHFHGNAQNMSTHVRFAEWLPARGYDLMVFDYRGFGESGGTPQRWGLVRDGMAALEVARTRGGPAGENLFVWGQSLGGTVALQSMRFSPVPVRAAVIDSAFESHARIAAEKMRHLPWFLQPLRLLRPLLISGGADARDALPHLRDLPLAFLHGEEDRVIPVAHSQRLHARAPEGTPLWIIPGAGHCDAVLRFPDKVRPLLLDFFEGHRLPAKNPTRP